MKNLILLFIICIAVSCKPTGIEKLISDYEQTMGNTKIDLNLKINKLEKTGEITASDSAKLIINELTETVDPNRISIIEKMKFKNELERSNKWIEVMDSMFRNGIGWEDWMKIKSKIIQLQKLEATYITQDPKAALAYNYKCTYTIKNPILNGIKQEITNTYIVNKSLTAIIKKEEK